MKILSKIREAKQRLSGFWAIHKDSYKDIVSIHENFEKNPKAFIQDMNAASLDDMFNAKPDEILSINGNEATIRIHGPLVDRHDCATVYFGCTSYEHIVQSIKEVESLDRIEKIIFDVDSPGGMVAGVDSAAMAMNAIKIPTEARVSGMAASAAYWLASQCSHIVATCATAQFGSIGVVIEYWDGTRMMNEKGFDKVSITSSGAPNKRVDALSDEGRRKIKSDLDEIEDVFFRRVASGRGVTKSDVSAKFGQGGMLLAEKSLRVGMIDSTEFILDNKVNSNHKEEIEMESNMNLKEFLSNNPDEQAGLDKMISDAVAGAVTEKEKEHKKTLDNNKEVIEKASKYLSSEYDKKVKSLALKVIKGESSIESLDTIVTLFDETEEGKKSEAAASETEEVGETPSSKEVTTASQDVGVIKDEDSYQETIARLKKYK